MSDSWSRWYYWWWSIWMQWRISHLNSHNQGYHMRVGLELREIYQEMLLSFWFWFWSWGHRWQKMPSHYYSRRGSFGWRWWIGRRCCCSCPMKISHGGWGRGQWRWVWRYKWAWRIINQLWIMINNGWLDINGFHDLNHYKNWWEFIVLSLTRRSIRRLEHLGRFHSAQLKCKVRDTPIQGGEKIWKMLLSTKLIWAMVMPFSVYSMAMEVPIPIFRSLG